MLYNNNSKFLYIIIRPHSTVVVRAFHRARGPNMLRTPAVSAQSVGTCTEHVHRHPYNRFETLVKVLYARRGAPGRYIRTIRTCVRSRQAGLSLWFRLHLLSDCVYVIILLYRSLGGNDIRTTPCMHTYGIMVYVLIQLSRLLLVVNRRRTGWRTIDGIMTLRTALS